MTKPGLYIKCRLTPGQFSDEYAVSFADHRGEPLSLFTNVGNASPYEGLRVTVLEEKDDLLLVRLPSEIEGIGGYFVTLRRDQCTVIV